MTDSSTILEVSDLFVTFKTYDRQVSAVRGVNFNVKTGETLAIVGESGSGKSATCQAIAGLHPASTMITGAIRFEDKQLLNLPERELQRIRGAKIAMIFQDPMSSLNPTMTVGNQVIEAIVRHQNVSHSEAKKRAVDLLYQVEIPLAEKRLHDYPHRFSGGMRQRVMIAIALSCHPKILIADEPTTALDVTVQAQILTLLQKLQQKMGLTIILVTHNLAIVERHSTRVLVMYGGKVVEEAPANMLFTNPQHPYTKALLQAIPRFGRDRNTPLATIEGTPPDLSNPPTGCPFWTRCGHAMRICAKSIPESTCGSDHSHKVACWLQHPLAKVTSRQINKQKTKQVVR